MKANEWELNHYCECLKQADDLYHRAERAKHNSRPNIKSLMNVASHNRGLSSRALLHRRAETAYEFALEVLEQLLEDYSYLRTYLDRPVIFGMNTNVSPDIEGVPRLKSSHSQYVIRDRSRDRHNESY